MDTGAVGGNCLHGDKSTLRSDLTKKLHAVLELGDAFSSAFLCIFVHQSAAVKKPGVHKVDTDQVVLFSTDVNGWKVKKTCKR